jgi:hypothetical protein
MPIKAKSMRGVLTREVSEHLFDGLGSLYVFVGTSKRSMTDHKCLIHDSPLRKGFQVQTAFRRESLPGPEDCGAGALPEPFRLRTSEGDDVMVSLDADGSMSLKSRDTIVGSRMETYHVAQRYDAV